MKQSNHLWKAATADRIPEGLAAEIDVFETQLQLKRQGRIEDRVFAESRLRRGVYGQRYDNGQRHDGKTVQRLAFPSGDLTKGPHTLWDAPGMQRIKVPFGGLNAEQLETMAEIAEEYSVGLAHVTTRQDFQLHFVHLENTPSLMRRLAAVGITTREACGNVVRNVTACPYAGVCQDEPFDVSGYAGAMSKFLLGHPDAQDFGRKFKPAFSGCREHACGLVNMHDLGALAVTRAVDGRTERGFELYVGGGLGAVPNQAKVLEPFVTPDELLPTTQAIARVFARLGEKKNRNRARLKFLLRDLGLERFRELVREERAALPYDPAWRDLIAEAEQHEESALQAAEASPVLDGTGSERYREWLRTNIRPQRQAGYFVATVTLPLGDITAEQLRALADIARKYTRESVRTTVEQNIVLRWVAQQQLPALHADLEAAGLGDAGAGSIVDIVSCPGTDTCKLGISASRGLAGELHRRLAERSMTLDAAVRNLHIKISGCFNSCGQHHIADLGFYGVSRKLGGKAVPHFQVILGGQWSGNAAAYGLPILAVPSRRIPEVVERLCDYYIQHRQGEETFQQLVGRVGKLAIKGLLEDLVPKPGIPIDPALYTDWGDARTYSTGDIGVGECAGEVVSLVEFGLSAAERQIFEAQVSLDSGLAEDAARGAYEAMLSAAATLVRTELQDLPTESDRIVAEFRTRFYDSQRIFDPYAGGKFASYLFSAHERSADSRDEEQAHMLIEEAQLFVEAAYACYSRMSS